MPEIFPLIPITFAILFYSAHALPSRQDSDEHGALKDNHSDDDDTVLNGLLGDKGLLTKLIEAWSEKLSPQINLTLPASFQYDEEFQTLVSAVDETEKRSRLDTTGWTRTLFGQTGVLKKVIDTVGEDRKKVGPVRKELDFGRIFNGLLENAREKKYGEPIIPEIPDIGICDRLSCGDIYKAIDEFRTSEFFSNFQTGLQLMQDPEGWQLISDVISNPELLSTLTDTPEEEEVDKSVKPLKPSPKELPETSLSIDGGGGGGGSDYYSQVESGVDTGNIDYNVGEQTQKPKNRATNGKSPETLPDVSFSIDDGDTGATDYASSIDSGTHVEETIEIPKETVIVSGRGESRHKPSPTKRTKTTETTRTTTIPRVTKPRTKVPMTSRSTTKTTTKSFRAVNDYYAMYYDN